MARLIDAKLAQHIANVELSHDDAGTVQWVLSHTPTVDAVPVVRCKDCIYFHKPLYIGFGKCSKTRNFPYEEDFCSYGERVR